VRTTPVLVNEGRDIIFAGQGGTVYNCTRLAKLLNWQFSTEGDQLADLTVDESGVYVASTDRSLYRLDPASGAPRWRVRFPEPLQDPPQVAGPVVYQYCVGEGVVALEVDTGNLMWRINEARAVIGQNPDFVLLADGGRILKVAAKTGELLASVALQSEARPVAQVEGDMIYIVTRRGAVVAAHPEGSPHLTPAQIAQARRELHRRPQTEETVEDEEPPAPPPADEIIDRDDPLRSRSDRRQ
jgi:outer membrane protein assembly factor BamB